MKSSIAFQFYKFKDNIMNFYNNYKDNLNVILNFLYEKLDGETEALDYIEIYHKIKLKSISIESFNLICEYIVNKIILKNTLVNNCYVDIKFLRKIQLKKGKKIEKIWACNNEIAMILIYTSKYIYYYRNENEDMLKDNIENISFIGDFDSLDYAIRNNKIIYSTNKNIIERNILKTNKYNTKKLDVNFFFKGINAYNFETKNMPNNYELLPVDINFSFSFLKSNNNCFLYNSKIGMTLYILNEFYTDIIENKKNKFFYVNINYVKGMKTFFYIKQFLLFYLKNLFENINKFKDYCNEVSDSLFLQNYSELLYQLIEKFLKKTVLNPLENYYFLFDNIYDKDTFLELQKKMAKLELSNNIYFCFFVQLNEETLDFLFWNKYKFIFINNNNDIRPKEYFDSLTTHFYEEKYPHFLLYDFKKILDKYKDLDKFILMLKLKYITITNNFYSEEHIKEILANFYRFLNISCINKVSEEKNIEIKSINFINKKVKNFIYSQIDSILSDYLNNKNLNFFDTIINLLNDNDKIIKNNNISEQEKFIKAMEGILLEKQIVLKLIASLFFQKLQLKRIYCCNSFPSINYDYYNNIIIIQELDNAPIYDFAVIIYINGFPIIKFYQIGINKDPKELEKLDSCVIFFDVEFFIKNLENKYGIKIKQYSFGIITTKSAYDNYFSKNNNIINEIDFKNKSELINNFNGENPDKNYKNYFNTKIFCEKNKYEFIIFDKEKTTFNTHEVDNKLKEINFFNYYNKDVMVDVKRLYDRQNINNLIKLYYNKNDNISCIENIKTLLKGNLEIKIIGKFNYLNNEIPKIEGENLYLYWEDIKNGHFCLEHNRKIISSCKNIKQISFKGANFIACLINGVIEEEKHLQIKIVIPSSNNNNNNIEQ